MRNKYHKRRCAVCGERFRKWERFRAWEYTNVFFLYEGMYPVHKACAKDENVPILEALAKKDSISNVMDIRKNAFEVDL
jgi:AAA+ superfamily predicted ATPase